MTPTTLILDGLWGWTGRLNMMLRTIQNQCGPAEVFAYNASGTVRLETLGEQLAAAIRRIGHPVNLVGFSMGGMVIRAAHLLDPKLPIQRVAFLNTPHQGTWMAYTLPFEGIRQMRPNSDFIRQIDAADWRIPTLAVWCPLDLIVVPGSFAQWTRATHTVCSPMPAHIWPLFSGAVHRMVCCFLNDTPHPSLGPIQPPSTKTTRRRPPATGQRQ